jgi:SAM-dependent methyltransferase
MKIRPMVQLLRAGNGPARLSAVRSGQTAVRVAAVGAGLRLGVLDALSQRSASGSELAESAGWSDDAVLDAFLHVLGQLGLVRQKAGRWQLARRGRQVVEDDVVRASYEAFSGYHTGLYAELAEQLRGGTPRRDIEDEGELIARLSRVMNPFVLAALDEQVDDRQPERILDVGCGSGSHLVHLLQRAPEATGLGVETDAAAAALAGRTIEDAALGRRAEVVEGDVRKVLAGRPADETFDLVLLANVIYYLPMPERVDLLRSLAERMAAGGRLIVITTALVDDAFSRHFDLLLRTQRGEMGLPDLDVLAGQLRSAGLVPGEPRRIALGEPLTTVVARKP